MVFFCDPFLELVLRVADAANALGWFSTTNFPENFPGSKFYWGNVSSDPSQVAALAKRAGVIDKAERKLLKVFLSGRYLECVKDVLESADFGLKADWTIAELAGKYDHQRELLGRGRFSMVTKRPTASNVHNDDGQVVINIHLSRDFEDTGTAFYETKKGLQACQGDTAALRDCKDATDTHGVFCMIEQNRLASEQPCEDRQEDCAKRVEEGACSRMPASMYRDCTLSCGVCSGLWPGPHVPGGEDHSGSFKVHHVVPFKMNRLVVYSGGLFHSGHFAIESIPRLATKDPRAGRLGIQHFLPEPRLVRDSQRLASVDGVFGVIRRIKAKAPVGRVPRKTWRLVKRLANSEVMGKNLAAEIKGMARPEEAEL